MTNVAGIAAAWFLEEDWPLWLAIDPDFQPDYNHWHTRMEDRIKSVQAQGQRIVKMTIRPDEFMAWSKATGSGIDSHARAAYAAFRLARQDTDH